MVSNWISRVFDPMAKGKNLSTLEMAATNWLSLRFFPSTPGWRSTMSALAAACETLFWFATQPAQYLRNSPESASSTLSILDHLATFGHKGVSQLTSGHNTFPVMLSANGSSEPVPAAKAEAP